MYGKIEPEKNSNRMRKNLILTGKVFGLTLVLGALFWGVSLLLHFVNERWLHLGDLGATSLGQAGIMAIALLLPLIDRGGYRNLGIFGKWKGYDAAVIPGIITVQFVGSMITVGIMYAAGLLNQEQNVGAMDVFSQFGALDVGTFMYTGLGLALQAGIGEELLFRGYVITRLERLGLSGWSIILLSALIFGLVHVPGYGWLNSLSKAIWFGIPTGAYFWYRRNLGPLMIAHALMDYIGFLLMFVILKLSGGHFPTLPQ